MLPTCSCLDKHRTVRYCISIRKFFHSGGKEMADKDKPLPKPPNKAFGNKKRFEEEDDQSTLIADRMAAAMAEGKLDEFIKQELPDNEYARNLVSMMMGMTGMLPMGGGPASSPSPAP